MIEHIKNGLSAQEIADFEGLEIAYAGKQRKEVADAERITLPPPSRKGFRALGLDDENSGFRFRLGQLLRDVRTIYHPSEVSTLIGLTNREQNQAINMRVGHNWTLGQMHRLAKVLDWTFEELITHANTKQFAAPLKLRRK